MQQVRRQRTQHIRQHNYRPTSPHRRQPERMAGAPRKIHTFTARFEIFTPRFEIFTPRMETFTPRMQIAVCKIAAVDVGLECISGIEVIEKS